MLFVNSWVVPYAKSEGVKKSRPLIRVRPAVDGSAEDYGGWEGGASEQGRVNLLADDEFSGRYSRYSVREKFV